MVIQRFQPVLRTDPVGITTEVALGPLNETGRELHGPARCGLQAHASLKLQETDLRRQPPSEGFWDSCLSEGVEVGGGGASGLEAGVCQVE